MLEVQILRFLEGAANAQGLTVIIDVLRASSTIVTVLEKKANHIIPCGSLEESYLLKSKGYKLIGERGGVPPLGFDYPNSPSLLYNEHIIGNKYAINTQGGSQGIVQAKKASDVIIGCFLNYSALVEYIRRSDTKLVSLVAMGHNDQAASYSAVEDEEFAKLLQARLLGRKIDIDAMFQRISQDSALAKYFDGTNDFFPKKDYEFCMQLDKFKSIPRVFRYNSLSVVRKENISYLSSS
jgi:2-phosphosulfolactate phosphatase